MRHARRAGIAEERPGRADAGDELVEIGDRPAGENARRRDRVRERHHGDSAVGRTLSCVALGDRRTDDGSEPGRDCRG